MTPYILIVAILLLVVLFFYFFVKYKSTIIITKQSLLTAESQEKYTNAALRCRKNNSPVLKIDFNQTLLGGENLVNSENFLINDSVVKESDYRVL